MVAEKLTIVPPLSVRLTESQLRIVQKLADLNGMEKGEYIRHLVLQDEEKERRIWAARDQLFAESKTGATNGVSDKVVHE
jgi:Arc/MetJ-type ribon-helix-helix transcriptional regulator